jgi:DsbC/DsbD-like thiol-disulfide interchange protein
MKHMQRSVLTLFWSLFVAAVFAGNPVSWSFTTKETATGQPVAVLQATCEEGWHLYALTLPREDGPFPTVISVTPSDLFKAGAPVEPQPVEVEDPNFQMLVRYHGHVTEFTVPIERLSKEAFTVEGAVEYMCCNDKMCLPPVTVKFSVPFPAVK